LKTGGYPIEEFYRSYGQCQMAQKLEVIKNQEFMDLNNDVVAEGIDNTKYFNL